MTTFTVAPATHTAFVCPLRTRYRPTLSCPASQRHDLQLSTPAGTRPRICRQQWRAGPSRSPQSLP